MAKKHVRETLTIGNLTFVELTMGRVAVVDTADAHLIAGDNWQANIHTTNIYAGRSQWVGDRYVKVKLHRVLLGAPEEFQVDHIDGDGLNNRRANLRLVTHKQNCWNQRVASNNTSGFRGVCYIKDRNRWAATIRVNGISKTIGRFKTAHEAHMAYAAEARRHYGEFARP